MSNIGRIIYGYCDGYFGRDSYHEKIIIGEGYNWIVVKDWNGVDFACLPADEKQELINEWSVEKESDYY